MDQSLYHQSLTIQAKTSPTHLGKLRVGLQLLSSVTRTIHVGVTNAGGEIKHEIEEDLPSHLPLSLVEYLGAEDVLLIFVYGDDFDLDGAYLQVDEESQHLITRFVETDSLHTQFLIDIDVAEEHPFHHSSSLYLLPWLSSAGSSPC